MYISNFSSSATLGAHQTSGDVTGALKPGPLTLTADQAFNEWLQPVTFGSGVTTFDLSLTTSFIGGSTPDAFSFFLLDSSQVPLPTSDPLGADEVFSIEITGPGMSPSLFASTASPSQFTASVHSLGAVPEPSSGLLLCLTAGMLVLMRRLARGNR